MKGNGVALSKRRQDLTLDSGAIRDTANAGNIYGNPGTILPLGTKTANHQTALSHRIDLAICAFQRCHQQGTAAQAVGIADGGNRDINLLPGLGKRWQCGTHGYGCDIGEFRIHAFRQSDAELVHHVPEGLIGERCLVAGSVKTNHESVAHQLVVPYPFDPGQVLQPVRHHRCRDHRQGKYPGKKTPHAHSGHHSLLKKRASQPIWLAWSKSPVPP